MENSDNKLITVYEIKPEIDEDGTGLGGRDVLVEIVSSPEEHLLRGTATIAPDGTLLIGSPDGNDLHTHLTIPASMAAAMGLTTTSLSQHGDQCNFIVIHNVHFTSAMTLELKIKIVPWLRLRNRSQP